MKAGVVELSSVSSQAPEEYDVPRSLSVLTLNIAHGRGERAHQLFLRDQTIKSCLSKIAKLFQRTQVDIVALQECDIASFWNGNFHQLEYLASKTPHLPYGATAQHVHGLKLSYGTSILSRFPLSDTRAFRFADGLPLPRKGFLVSELCWPGDESFRFLYLSLHLDFLRLRTRTRQVEQVAEVIETAGLPCIVGGDFNCTWHDKDSAVRQLSERCGLHSFEVENTGISTFRFSQRRWDWILLSSHFGFQEHSVLSEKLSDHKAVLAEVTRVS